MILRRGIERTVVVSENRRRASNFFSLLAAVCSCHLCSSRITFLFADGRIRFPRIIIIRLYWNVCTDNIFRVISIAFYCCVLRTFSAHRNIITTHTNAQRYTILLAGAKEIHSITSLK